MSLRLRVLSALPEDLAWVPSTHMAAVNWLYLQFQGILLASKGHQAQKWCIDIHAGKDRRLDNASLFPLCRSPLPFTLFPDIESVNTQTNTNRRTLSEILGSVTTVKSLTCYGHLDQTPEAVTPIIRISAPYNDLVLNLPASIY